jgi:hypothetical protein
MKHSLGPLLCLLVAACSSNRQPESSYDAADTARVEASDSEQGFVPASSDAADADAADTDPANPDAVGSDAVDAATDAPSRSVAPATIPPAAGESPKPSAARDSTPAAPDNTKVNQRDRDDSAPTPIDQGNNASDLEITQQIRKAVVADDALSFSAKNVKIITTNGKVTLRGPVKSAEEREKIAAMARKVAGAANVDNQLEVAK